MHLLVSSSASLDDAAEPLDLRQTPAEIVALSFSDSDLGGLAAAWRVDANRLPTMRLAALRDLRHPMSVDLWIDSVAAHAKVVLVRILGGYDWWRYGCDRLAAIARERGVTLALLPGECRDEDLRLIEASTLPRAELEGLLEYFREGGPANMTALLARLAGLAGAPVAPAVPVTVPRGGFYLPGRGIVDDSREVGQVGARTSLSGIGEPANALSDRPPFRPWPIHSVSENTPSSPAVPILFYRSLLLAADVAPVEALYDALLDRGMRPVPVFVSSLKDPISLAFVEKALADLAPSCVVTTTAFASDAESGAQTMFDRAGVPVFQAIVATTRREAWEQSARGLAPADLAMHVVLPELDGRILAGAISFKAETPVDAELGFRGLVNLPEAELVAAVADRVAAITDLRQTPRAERKLAILIPDYPGAPGRTGYAVGLDVPSSVLAMLHDLKAQGYGVDGIPQSPRELLAMLNTTSEGMSREDYSALASDLPKAAMDAVEAAWGPTRRPSSPCRDLLPVNGEKGADRDATASPSPRLRGEGGPEGRMRGSAEHAERGSISEDPGPFHFRAATFGNITVALAPERGRTADRRADYHDPALPPRHELIAFGLWLRHTLGVHALVHVGAHGTLEWLPGKTVALTPVCFPAIIAGALPVIYPFIVSNPGEAAQAKRRIAAVTLGHLPPPLVAAGLDDDRQALERLVDEYAQADGLDRRRRDRLAQLIVDTAARSGVAVEAGVENTDAPDEALRRIDAWLCDLKDLAIKDGLHIYGRSPVGETDAMRLACAEREREGLIAALDGNHIPAGPAGTPTRGRADVLPTGRNLFTMDPRAIPTRTACDLGRVAADEVLRRYAQDHGDWPRSLVIDLWGSASLRTGGEEIAQGLAMMGCRPRWDPATGRVTGVDILPLAALGRSRVDVTWRISGLFRDMFPVQIALLDAAAKAVAGRDEDAADNPLAAETRAMASVPARIFGSSLGTYGAGIEELLASGAWTSRDDLGRAYLAAASHAYSGADGAGKDAPGAFEACIAGADLLLHAGDDPGRDILEGSADAAFIGGFSAAQALLGGSADVITLDTTDPARPRPRSLVEAVTRVVRSRAIHPRFIAGQMRHGPRGASEFAETVDRLIGFAETTQAIPGALIDAVHAAYLGDPVVRGFILRENPAAARAIALRFADARRRGLWHPLRNSLDGDLAALLAEANSLELAA